MLASVVNYLRGSSGGRRLAAVDLLEGTTLAYRRTSIELFGMNGDDPAKRKEWGNRGGDSDERMRRYCQRH